MIGTSTPKQIKEASTKELLTAYKEKARCLHSQRKASMIFSEIIRRLGLDTLKGVRIGYLHMQGQEGDAEFNQEIDKLIANCV